MAKRPKYPVKPNIINVFTDRTIPRPMKPGEVTIPEGHPFYDWYYRMLKKYGGEEKIITRKTPDGEPLVLIGDLIDFGLKTED